MSSRTILCQVKKADNPYYIEDINRYLYSVEELCYFIDHNLAMVDDGFFDSSLTGWIRTELDLPDLADRMDAIVNGSTADDEPADEAAFLKGFSDDDDGKKADDADSGLKLEKLIYAVNAEISWIYAEDRQAFRKEIIDLLHLFPGERMKRRADMLVGYGKYTRAITVYKSILRELPEKVGQPVTLSDEKAEKKDAVSSEASEPAEEPAVNTVPEEKPAPAAEQEASEKSAASDEQTGTSEAAEQTAPDEQTASAGQETSSEQALEAGKDVKTEKPAAEAETEEAAGKAEPGKSETGEAETKEAETEETEDTSQESGAVDENSAAEQDHGEDQSKKDDAAEQKKKEERLTILEGSAWHNMGVAYAKLFQFDEACDCMRRAFHRLRTHETVRDYLYCVYISSGKEAYEDLAKQLEINEETRREIDEAIESVGQPEDPDNVDEALNSWVREYHRETAP
ncbi:MAG: hypothetical protein SOI56_08080 [Eubacteriales bacterium]|jgi:tetratricopeptide (TPR) repeat protein